MRILAHSFISRLFPYAPLVVGVLVPQWAAAELSTSLTWMRYEQTIHGTNLSRDVEPEEWALGLFYPLDEQVFVALNLAQGAWQGDWDARTTLELDSRGAGVSVSLMDAAWTRSLGFQYGENQLQGQRTDMMARVEEDYRYREWYAALAYDYLWEVLWLSPKLKLAWQDSDWLQSSEINFRNGQLLTGRDKQEQDGSYAQVSVYASVEFDTAQLLVNPYVLFSWSEVLSGRVVRTSERQSASRRLRSDPEIADDNSAGSGQLTLGLSVYLQAANLDVSFSEPIDNADYGRSIALSLGYDF